MEASLFGYQLNGYIAINESMFELPGTNPAILDKILETLIHEGLHAYQHYNVEEHVVHQSETQVHELSCCTIDNGLVDKRTGNSKANNGRVLNSSSLPNGLVTI